MTKILKDKEIIIYSRDCNYHSLVNKNISIYLNKILINGFDEILSTLEFKKLYNIKQIESINNIRALCNSGFAHLKSMPEVYYAYFIILLKKFSFDECFSYVKFSIYWIDFLKEEYDKNLQFFNIPNISNKDFKLVENSPNQKKVVEILIKNSMNKEASIIEHTYPILTSKI